MMRLNHREKRQWFKKAINFLRQKGHSNIKRGWIEIAELLEPLVGAELPPSKSKGLCREWAILALAILTKTEPPPDASSFVGRQASKAEIKALLNENEKRLKISADLSQPPPMDKFRRFYRSYDWRRLRFLTLEKYGRRCMCCGKTAGVMSAVRIKSLKKYWDLRLDPNNVQVLCGPCNHGKGNQSETDFRPVVIRLGVA